MPLRRAWPVRRLDCPIEHVRFHEKGDGNGHWGSVPLIRIKTLNRTLAWSVAAVVSRLLDID
ncbi:hypothetical protein PWR63_01085 [Paraburkholderia sp. A2WS-5]|uniref:hypothetical protein n=1 Tax=unclassified Paraburkholderia TaxID=2615204 RepID=UPI003B762C2F